MLMVQSSGETRCTKGRHSFTATGLEEGERTLCLGSYLFLLWLNTLDEKLSVANVVLRSVVKTPQSEKILFIYMSATFTDNEGRQMTHTFLLRGRGVLVVVVLDVAGAEYVPLVRQSRIAVGQHNCYELPGGGVDKENYLSSAVEELMDEAGVLIRPEKLLDLTAIWGATDGVFGSPGLLDERARIFAIRLEITEQELEALQNKATGSDQEQEYTTVLVLPFKEALLWLEDAKSKLGLFMYKEWRAQSAA